MTGREISTEALELRPKMFTIAESTRQNAISSLPGLSELLLDTVADGASIGFVDSLTAEQAQAYWQEVIADMHPEAVALIIATTEAGEVAGAAQIARSPKGNGAHRAEVRKLMVHRKFRRQGLARKIMDCLHELAKSWKVKLLVLDTATGEPAELLYKNMGYVYVGEIPGYATSPAGELHGTSFYYRQL